MRFQPKSKMFFNMLGYGTVLGGLGGAISMVILVLSADSFQFTSHIVPVMLIEVLSIATFGLINGCILGLIAGVYGGFGMTVITSLFYSDIASRNVYKLVMGVIATVCTAFFLYRGVWHLRLDGIDPLSWNIAMAFLVGLAIYASQRVASTYLYEWSLRNRKKLPIN
jgi:hypothetical protein